MYETKTMEKAYKVELIYPDLSYKVIGILFDVFTGLGYGFKEKHYQKAIETTLKQLGIDYKKELPVRVDYKGKFITTLYLDFLIDDKIVLELKQGNRFNKSDIEQVYQYLKAANLKLGILARFTSSGVKFLRILNIR